MKDPKLNKYERELLDSIERGEWKPVKNEKKEIERYRQIFRENFKDRMISIRVNSADLESFKIKAEKAGIPYQTLLASLMKRFVEGKVKLDI